MIIKADTVDEYLNQIPDNQKDAFTRLRETIKNNLPQGFEETISFGMIGYVVPKSVYPDGYHAKPEEPLPFVSLGVQKQHIAIYHSGIYMNKDLQQWFIDEYKKHLTTKLDMGKSCIRFKNYQTVPYILIGELCKKMTVDEYIKLYQKAINK